MTHALDGLNEINAQVQSGELSGFSRWPESGKCTIESVEMTIKAANQYIAVKLKAAVGVREFLIRVPNKNDKDGAKFMGMQRIYQTIYMIGSKVGEDTPQEAYDYARKNCRSAGQFRYTLSDYKSFSEKSGKTFVNQALENLEKWNEINDEEFT